MYFMVLIACSNVMRIGDGVYIAFSIPMTDSPLFGSAIVKIQRRNEFLRSQEEEETVKIFLKSSEHGQGSQGDDIPEDSGEIKRRSKDNTTVSRVVVLPTGSYLHSGETVQSMWSYFWSNHAQA